MYRSAEQLSDSEGTRYKIRHATIWLRLCFSKWGSERRKCVMAAEFNWLS